MGTLLGNQQTRILFVTVFFVVMVHNDYWYLCYCVQLVPNTQLSRGLGEKNMAHLCQGSMKCSPLHIDGQDLSTLLPSSASHLPFLPPLPHLHTIHLHPKLGSQQPQIFVNTLL